MKTAMVRARVEEHLKVEVEHVLDKLGLSVSEAINLFLAQIKLTKGIPFDIKIPNRATRKALEDSAKGRHLTRCKDVKELFKKLNI